MFLDFLSLRRYITCTMHFSIAHTILILLHTCLFTHSALAARSQGGSYALKERHHVPARWACVGRAPSWHMIQLQVGLKQSRFNELERYLYEGKNSYTGHVLSISVDLAPFPSFDQALKLNSLRSKSSSIRATSQ